MKKHIFLLFSFLCLFFSAHAQYQMVVTLNDGTTITKQVWDIQSVTFEPIESIAKPDTAEAVDLGLSVKWAAANFGAKSATDPGYYIGWGDATGKNHSTILNYFPVLNPSADIVNANYDIVHVLWGKQWRMPTMKEIKELIDNCSWSYDETKKGWTVTSKKDNTKSIFLPIAGFRLGEDVSSDFSAYWSGSLSSTDNTKASVLVIDPTSYTTGDTLRYLGLPIRPVYGPYYEGAKVKSATVTNVTKTDAYVQVKFVGNYSDASEIGLAYGNTSSIDPDQNTKITAEVSSISSSDSTYTFHIENLTPNTKYYYVAYIVYQSKRNTSATQNFTTLPKFPVADMVDLGLSVKWASWNIGASSAQEYGSYIAWGDSTGENSSYVNDEYPNDMSDISGTKYDVATRQWGGEWRMPTPTEWKELDSLTTKEIVTLDNGVKAYKLTSTKNNNTIYIPRGGYETKNGKDAVNSEADYWTSENTAQSWAKGIKIGKVSSTFESQDEKGWHMLIRPVYGKKVDPNKPVVVTKDTTEAGKAAKSVDLGLSVRWATYNLGATSSSQIGSYFSWGSVEPESAGYDFSRTNHPFYKNGSFTIPSTAIENTDYDAAATLWGGTWRMPTEAEMDELVSKCTWTKTSMGYTVKGPNGNTIFLPFTGIYSGTSLSSDTQCYYWSSTYNTLPVHADDYWAQHLATTKNDTPDVIGTYIYKGMCIRPVQTK